MMMMEGYLFLMSLTLTFHRVLVCQVEDLPKKSRNMKKPSRDKVVDLLLTPILNPTRIFKKPKRAKTGLAPGSIIYTGKKWVEKTTYEVIN